MKNTNQLTNNKKQTVLYDGFRKPHKIFKDILKEKAILLWGFANKASRIC